MDASAGQFLDAVRPLVQRIGASMVDPAEIAADDVPLVWRGTIVAGVRLAARRMHDADRPAGVGDDAGGGLGRILDDVQAEFGTPLAQLPRAEKQRAVRLLEEAGAFAYRRSVETVAASLGVSRFTVYNYLNRDRD
jgi:HTH domain